MAGWIGKKKKKGKGKGQKLGSEKKTKPIFQKEGNRERRPEKPRERNGGNEVVGGRGTPPRPNTKVTEKSMGPIDGKKKGGRGWKRTAEGGRKDWRPYYVGKKNPWTGF